jgi:hypothetical protein
MVSEGGVSSQPINAVPEFAVDLLAREETLRSQAPAVVGEPAQADIDAYLKTRFGEPENDEAYRRLLADTITNSGLTQDEFYALTRAQLLHERMRDHFKTEVPTAGEQRHLLRARLNTEAAANRLRERVAAGEDFEAVSTELGIQFGFADVGWLPLDVLGDEQSVTIASVAPGASSQPIPVGAYYDVWRVVAIEASRELTEDQRNVLANQRVDDWIKERESSVPVHRDLSGSEAQWIRQQVSAKVAANAGR